MLNVNHSLEVEDHMPNFIEHNQRLSHHIIAFDNDVTTDQSSHGGGGSENNLPWGKLSAAMQHSTS